MDTTNDINAPNGLDSAAVDETRRTIQGHPERANVRLRARSRWITGAHSRSLSQDFHAGLRRHPHLRSYVFELDYPQALGGGDAGPTPAEYVLYGFAGDLIAAVVLVAGERDVGLSNIEVEVEGRMDARPALGLEAGERPGYQHIDATVALAGDAPAEQLAAIVAVARRRAPVLDTLTNAVPVHVRSATPDSQAG